jgi:hypothetical protein
MGITDYIGGRGEAIAFACLTRRCRTDSDLPFFWPHYLGEKCETFDFLVELIDAGERTPFFFVQVKTTRRGITRSRTRPRLPIEVSQKDVRRMASYPAPTYVIGVQEEEERAFVISVHGVMSEAIRSITTAHELTCETLGRLWEEVQDYWQGCEMMQWASSFSN